MSIRIMSEIWKTRLPTSEKMVLLVIADHASDDGTEAWPSQRLIAEKASLTIRTVQRCINNLQAEGWLHMDKRAGGSINCRDDRRPNKYTIHLGKLRGEIVSPRKKRGEIEAMDEAKLTPATGRNPRPMNHTKETPMETPSEFEIFWKIYPRKTAKGAARKAWDKLTEENKKVAIAGAERFAKDPNREDLWTPYPATWLNAEQWEDEPLPPLKLSPEAIREAEKVRAREKAQREREAAESLAKLEEAAREKAVPMPDYLKDLLRRV